MKKKFIEEQFPISEISELGGYEKSNNYGNINTIHPWWARRPTSVCRALILSCLFDYTEDKEERKKISQFIINACSDFQKLPNQISFKDQLNKLITLDSSNIKIKLLDPFSGGGAIPLEAARLGLKSYCSDLNPVAVLIGNATCVYFQKFNRNLAIELEKWWKILNKKFISAIQPFYSNPINQNSIYAFIWARQIRCPNHECKALIPMLSDCVLASKTITKNKKKIKKIIALKPVIEGKKGEKKINFIIQKDEEIDFNPSSLKIFSRGKVTCPSCEYTIKNNEVMEKVKEKKFKDRLIVIFEKNPHGEKLCRLATNEDYNLYKKAEEEFEKYKNLIPIEKLPIEVRRWQIQNYGILEWKEFFNKRQFVINFIFINKLKEVFNEIEKKSDYNEEFKNGIKLYLSFYLSKLINYNSKFCHWKIKEKSIAQTWSRAGIFMRGTYPENNPIINPSGTMENYYYYLNYVIENLINVKNVSNIKQADAAHLDYESDFFDLIITDPPYYDAMLYADPSDFFYIWLRRCLGDVFPELFLFPLTPKEEEIIQSRYRHGGDVNKAKKFYEYSLANVLMKFYRILKPNGIGVIMYTHKSVVAWEVLINAILKSNFTISAAWPIQTEKRGGIRTLDKVALASSIAIVFRKIKKENKIYFETQFRNILENELRVKLKELLTDLEIYGADFFISSIGFSLNIFTRYERVISQKTGEVVPVSEFLDLVRKVVNDFLLNTILEKSVTQSNDKYTNMYVIWCWFFRNNRISLDDALKLAQSFGIELDDLKKKRLITLDNNEFKLLLMSDEEREQFLSKNQNNLDNLIDHLHLLSILWKNSDRNIEESVEKAELKFGENIWKVGQALAEFFPSNHKEHNYLQGLLAKFGKTKTKTDLKKWL